MCSRYDMCKMQTILGHTAEAPSKLTARGREGGKSGHAAIKGMFFGNFKGTLSESELRAYYLNFICLENNMRLFLTHSGFVYLSHPFFLIIGAK